MAGLKDMGPLKEKASGYIKKLVNRFKKQDSEAKNDSETPEIPAAPFWRKKSTLVACGAVLVIAITTTVGINQYKINKERYIAENTFEIIHVYQNGEKIGSVESKDQIEKLIEEEKLSLSHNNPGINMVLETGTITYESEIGFQLYANTDETLETLKKGFTSYAEGVAIVVDGKQLGVVKDEATASNILNRLQSEFAPELVAQKANEPLAVATMSYRAQEASAETATTDSADQPSSKVTEVGFVEEVAFSEVNTTAAEIQDAEEVYQKILEGSTKPTTYVVQKGDCIGCIAQKFDISEEVIYSNNTWIEGDRITVGDELDLTVRRPDITVRTVETVVEVDEIAPPIEYRKNNKMNEGQTKTIQEGKPGSQKLTYSITRENGYILKEELVNKEVLVEATATIIEKGTLVVAGKGTGQFAYPISNAKLSSKYGKRWGRSHNGVDFTGDKNIKASDAGVVTFVGTQNGYGKTIIIDHGNGYETLYAHLKSYSVSKGDKVAKGDKIGVMGNTGRSTGTHLHFEIHKNGKAVNPLSYL